MRLPDGTVLTRRFRLTDDAASVFAWLAGCEELGSLLGEEWSLVLPARGGLEIEGGLLPTDETLAELDLCGVTLFVQDEAT